MTQLCMISVFISLATICWWAMRRLIVKYFKPKMRLRIQILIVLRAFIFFPIPFLFVPKIPYVKSAVQVVAKKTTSAVSAVAQYVADKPVEIDPWLCLFLVWITVGGTIYMLSAINTRLYCRRLKKSAGTVGIDWIFEMIDDLKTELNITEEICISATSHTNSPCIVCYRKNPILYIPDSIIQDEYYGKLEYRLILRHEFFHYMHHDNRLGSLLGFMCTIYWFNPFVFYFANLVRGEIECARDDEAIQEQGKKASIVLSDAIFRIEKGMSRHNKLFSMIYFSNKALAIKDRFDNLVDTRSSDSNSRLFPYFCIIAVISCCLNFTGFISQVPFSTSQFSSQSLFSKGSTQKPETVEISSPLENPESILIPHIMKRYPDSIVNRLIFYSQENTHVFSPISGNIIYTGYSQNNSSLGNVIIIENSTLTVVVCHINFNSMTTKVGSYVEQNQNIGTVGTSGVILQPGIEIIVTDSSGNPVELKEFASGYASLSA